MQVLDYVQTIVNQVEDYFLKDIKPKIIIKNQNLI